MSFTSSFAPDPSLWFPPCSFLQCQEDWNPEAHDDEHGSRVLFHCHVLLGDGQGDKRQEENQQACRALTFGMREASTGVLMLPTTTTGTREETSTVPQGPSHAVDPFFFDPGYTLYAATGFSLWPGSRLLVEALTWNSAQQTSHSLPSSSSAAARLRSMQQAIRHGTARILELGAGIGMVGSCLSVMGAQHVCLTDLSTLVEHGVQPNLERNGLDDTGKISTAVVDWTQPVPEELTRQHWDLIVASDCLLLQRLYQSALDTVDALLSGTTQFLFTFQLRGRNQQYTTLPQVLDAIEKQRGWHCECLAWRDVSLGSDGDEADSRNTLLLFRVTR